MTDRDDKRELLRDLHDLARVRPDAEATARAITRACLAVTSTASQPGIRRRNIMSLRNVSYRKVAAVAAALAVLALVAHWLTPAGGTAGLAFAEMQQCVNRTKSVQYLQTRQDFKGQKKTAPQETRKVKILGSHRMREEVTITTAGDPLPEGEIRLARPETYIMIQDMKSGKAITLYPDKKGYYIPHSVLGIDLNSGEVHEEKIEPAPEVDFYKRIREVPADKANRLPDRIIGGKGAAGFRIVEKVERPAGTDTWTKTYWVDPDTRLPVRIETTIRSTNPMMGESDFVLSDIVFDAQLDEALFTTDPPEGYRDLEVKE